MSMENSDGDFVEELLAKADILVPQLLKQLEDAVDDNGKKTVRYTCGSCGRGGTTAVEVVDAESARKLIETIVSLKLKVTQAKRDEPDAAAVKMQVDLSALSGDELAQRIVDLEAAIAADDASSA